MIPPSTKRLADSRGQSIIEFSLSSLMLILLMFGVFEMSRMMFVYTTVADAARAGARYAIVHGADAPATLAQVKTQVEGYLSAAPMNVAACAASSTCITASGLGGAAGSIVTVKVVYPYDPWVTFYSRFFSINISSTSEGVITW